MLHRFPTGCAIVAIVAATFVAAPAYAQAAPAADVAVEPDPSDANEPIVVTGTIAESQAASIREKRIAVNLVDVAAADAVGRFPDQNVCLL